MEIINKAKKVDLGIQNVVLQKSIKSLWTYEHRDPSCRLIETCVPIKT